MIFLVRVHYYSSLVDLDAAALAHNNGIWYKFTYLHFESVFPEAILPKYSHGQ